MTKEGAKNHAASVKQRLLNLSSKTKEEFGLVLIRYALERLLFRLSQSAFRDQFVVKGATLFALWTGEPHRATRDLDMLGIGNNSLDRLRDVFSAVCNTPADEDGLSFDAASIKISRIKEDQEYEGCRVELMDLLGTARISVQVDVGFGDARNWREGPTRLLCRRCCSFLPALDHLRSLRPATALEGGMLVLSWATQAPKTTGGSLEGSDYLMNEWLCQPNREGHQSISESRGGR